MFRALFVRVVLPIVPLAGVAACHTFGPVASPREFITTSLPARVTVTDTEGSTAVFETPRLMGDTLAGFVRGEYREVPLSTIKQVHARQRAPRRTLFSIIAGSVATAGILYLIAGAGPDTSSPPDEEDLP